MKTWTALMMTVCLLLAMAAVYIVWAYKDVADGAVGVVPGIVCCSGIYIDKE